MVSFSSAWVVTNFDDLLSLLRYFGEDQRISAMKKAQGDARMALWKEFYRTPIRTRRRQKTRRSTSTSRGSPSPTSGSANKATRVGRPIEAKSSSPWVIQTRSAMNRGNSDQLEEVQSPVGLSAGFYLDYRATLIFQDVTGFDRYQLTPSSRSDFDRVRLRVQHSTP